jgi:hypothetical protein
LACAQIYGHGNGPTVSGIRIAPASVREPSSEATSAWVLIEGSAVSLRLRTGTTSIPSSRPNRARESQQRIERGGNLGGAGIVGPQGSGGDGVSDPHPVCAHVLELKCARPRMLEVADQLAEDPGLIGVRDAARC